MDIKISFDCGDGVFLIFGQCLSKHFCLLQGSSLILSLGCCDLTRRIQPVSSVTTSSRVGVRDKTSQLLSRNMKAGLPRYWRICSQNIIHKLFLPSSYLGGCDISFRLKTTILVQTYFHKIFPP